MKRIITLLGIIAGICALGNGAKAQGFIIGITNIDTCIFGGKSVKPIVDYDANGTPIYFWFLETNFGDGSKLDTTAIVYNGGVRYTSFVKPHIYTTGGTYTIKHVLFAGSTRLDSMSQSHTVACTFIGGELYHDVNSDCLFNTSENHANGLATIEVDSAGTLVDTVYGWGQWWYMAQATTTTVYKFRLLAPPAAGFSPSCPGSGIITYTYIPSTTAVTGLDFGFNCSPAPSYDYSLSMTRALRGASSPGSSFINLLASNTSCHAGASTVTLSVSPKYNISTSGISPAPASVSGNTITWTLSGLSYGYSLLHVPLTPLSTTSNGDTACNYALITPTAGDINTANNVISACDSVRASWDPNEKSVSPNGPVSAGALLRYTIDFENLGNDTAFNIHVQDTLSPHLNAGSFALISASHSVIPHVYESSGSRIIKFDFPNIRLEDKTVPTRNKGQVVFSIRMNDDLPDGTVVANRAGIYFDANPVVMTEYAYSRIPFPGAIPPTANQSGIEIYPNPVSDAIRIRVKHKGWNEATLTNAVGQFVGTSSLTVGDHLLQMGHLSPGIYYLRTSGEAGVRTQKIEKR